MGIALAFAALVPGLTLRILGIDPPHPLAALAYGGAIVGAAFLLSWAAEAAQRDVSAGLAIAGLALIAVLPEYAVGAVFAWQGGNAVQASGAACATGQAGASPCSLVLANMTGANRLLIGLGWSMVVLIAWHRSRRGGTPVREVRLERANSVEISFLALATAYSLLLPLKHSVTPLDAAILIGIFLAYAVRVSRAPATDPELHGSARAIGDLPPARRRATVIGLLATAAAVIGICAEPFAHALVVSGRELGVSEFLLVQWLAPLASEAPELLVAGLFAWRLNTTAGLGTLVSSKVNQWTLLIGTLPIVFSVAAGGLHGLPIDPNQRRELFLTAAQSLFAVSVLLSLSLSTREALLLFGLFWAQFVLGAVLPGSLHGLQLTLVGFAYLALAGVALVTNRRSIAPVLRDGFRTPIRRLTAASVDRG